MMALADSAEKKKSCRESDPQQQIKPACLIEIWLDPECKGRSGVVPQSIIVTCDHAEDIASGGKSRAVFSTAHSIAQAEGIAMHRSNFADRIIVQDLFAHAVDSFVAVHPQIAVAIFNNRHDHVVIKPVGGGVLGNPAIFDAV